MVAGSGGGVSPLLLLLLLLRCCCCCVAAAYHHRLVSSRAVQQQQQSVLNIQTHYCSTRMYCSPCEKSHHYDTGGKLMSTSLICLLGSTLTPRLHLTPLPATNTKRLRVCSRRRLNCDRFSCPSGLESCLSILPARRVYFYSFDCAHTSFFFLPELCSVRFLRRVPGTVRDTVYGPVHGMVHTVWIGCGTRYGLRLGIVQD